MRAFDLAVVTEIALATALVCGSSLLLVSWWNLTRVDPGFDAENVYVAPMILDNSAYDFCASHVFAQTDVPARVLLVDASESLEVFEHKKIENIRSTISRQHLNAEELRETFESVIRMEVEAIISVQAIGIILGDQRYPITL